MSHKFKDVLAIGVLSTLSIIFVLGAISAIIADLGWAGLVILASSALITAILFWATERVAKL